LAEGSDPAVTSDGTSAAPRTLSADRPAHRVKAEQREQGRVHF